MSVFDRKQLRRLRIELVDEIRRLSLPSTKAGIYEFRQADGLGVLPVTAAGRKIVKTLCDRRMSQDRLHRILPSQLVYKTFYARVAAKVCASEDISSAILVLLIDEAIDKIRSEVCPVTIGVPVMIQLPNSPEHFNMGPVFFYKPERFEGEAPKIPTYLWDRYQPAARTGDYVAWCTLSGFHPEKQVIAAEFAAELALTFLSLICGASAEERLGLAGRVIQRGDRILFKNVDGKAQASFLGENQNPLFSKNWRERISMQPVLYGLCSSLLVAYLRGRWDDAASYRLLGAFHLRAKMRVETDEGLKVIQAAALLERLFNIDYPPGQIRRKTNENASAIIAYYQKESRETIVRKIREIYHLRSKLMHGGYDPFDPLTLEFNLIHFCDQALYSVMRYWAEKLENDIPHSDHQLRDFFESDVVPFPSLN